MGDKIFVQVDILPHPIRDDTGKVFRIGPSTYQRFDDAGIEEADDYVVCCVEFKRPALFFHINPDDLFLSPESGLPR